jgi:hypothetical protein
MFTAKIGEYTEGHLLNVAKGVVQKKTEGSRLLDVDAEERIPKFEEKGMRNLTLLSAWIISQRENYC